MRRSAHFQKQHLEEVRKVAVDVLEKEVVVLRRLGVLSLVPATDSKQGQKKLLIFWIAVRSNTTCLRIT